MAATIVDADSAALDRVPNLDMEMLQESLRYPLEAARHSIEGQVMVKALVNAKGKVTQCRIVQSVFPSLDSEAIRAVTQAKFTPAVLDQVPIACWVSVPVRFIATHHVRDVGVEYDTLQLVKNLNQASPKGTWGKLKVVVKVSEIGMISTGFIAASKKLSSSLNDKLSKAFQETQFFPERKDGIAIDAEITIDLSLLSDPNRKK